MRLKACFYHNMQVYEKLLTGLKRFEATQKYEQNIIGK